MKTWMVPMQVRHKKKTSRVLFGRPRTRRQLAGKIYSSRVGSVGNLSMISVLFERFDEFAAWAENLQLVVLGSTQHDPGIVLVPIEVADTISKATVHEEAICD